MPRSDDDIKRDVEEELRWDPRIDIYDVIGVAVKDGVVTLSGFVRRYDDLLEAEDAAKRVAGVVGVANDLEVRMPGEDERPDPDIARDAIEMLKNDVPDAWQRIKVIVRDGRVTLEGEVEWFYQRDAAENAVRSVPGVKDVSNHIELKPRAEAADLKRQIEEAFRRSGEVDASRIKVEAKGSEVVLTGVARSWAERNRAERIAWRAPGVTKVENRIVIEP